MAGSGEAQNHTSLPDSSSSRPPKGSPLNQIKQRRVIFLAVNRGAHDHDVAEIHADGIDDDSFYAILKQEYLRIRGLYFRLFSYMIYSHCRFVYVSLPIPVLVTCHY